MEKLLRQLLDFVRLPEEVAGYTLFFHTHSGPGRNIKSVLAQYALENIERFQMFMKGVEIYESI